MTLSHRVRMATAMIACALVLVAASASAEDDDKVETGWSGSIALGATVTAGTTDSFGGNAEAVAQREWEVQRLRLYANGVLTISDSERSANNQAVGGEYRYYVIDRRLYLYNNHEVKRDTVQLIQWQYVTNAGPGYRWWEADPKNRYFDTQVGIGYLHQDFLNTGVDDDDQKVYRERPRDRFTLSAGYEYSNVLFDTVDFTQGTSILVPVAPTGNEGEFIVRGRASASLPIAFGWAFRNSLVVEYQNEPAEDADNTNLTYTVGLEYKF